jgi:DNA-binding PadR family transcriptional regulator
MFYDMKPHKHSHRRWAFRLARHHGDGDFTPSGNEARTDRGHRGDRHRAQHGHAAADLRHILLALLAEQPRPGYALVQELENRSSGRFGHGPEAIYPALSYLEDIGHIAAETADAKRLYGITETGLLHLVQNRRSAEAALAGRGRRDFRHGTPENGADDASLHTARHALKAALLQKRSAGPEELRRVSAILDRAAAEILGG